MDLVVLALGVLPDDAARTRVLLSACSHFRLDLPAAPGAPAGVAARTSGPGASDVEAPEILESFRRG